MSALSDFGIQRHWKRIVKGGHCANSPSVRPAGRQRIILGRDPSYAAFDQVLVIGPCSVTFDLDRP